MGTRALTRVFEHGADVPLVTLYRQMDGYPDGHGKELLGFAKGMPITNGIRGDGKGTANGMGCFAAQLIAHFKRAAGAHYVTPADPGWDGYAYDIRPDRDTMREAPAALLLRVTYDGRVIYDGPLDAWDGSEPDEDDGESAEQRISDARDAVIAAARAWAADMPGTTLADAVRELDDAERQS